MRSLFGFDTESFFLESQDFIEPSRSPFIKERITVYYEGESLAQIVNKLENFPPPKTTFKIEFIQCGTTENKVTFQERRIVEKEIGLKVKGTVDLLKPEQTLAIGLLDGRWVFGQLQRSKSIWFKHQSKPHNYSTALSTKVARAIVNIAVPCPNKVNVIDPCCGIGTVLIEALSMGVNIVGSDINPLVLPHTRENLTHFGFTTQVTLEDIKNVSNSYDVAIIDMPYNLCSVLPDEEKFEMFKNAREFAKKIVVVSIEPLDDILSRAKFTIVDRCVAQKSTFTRHILVCT